MLAAITDDQQLERGLCLAMLGNAHAAMFILRLIPARVRFSAPSSPFYWVTFCVSILLRGSTDSYFACPQLFALQVFVLSLRRHSRIVTMVGYHELHLVRHDADAGTVEAMCSTGGHTAMTMVGYQRTGAMRN